MKIIPSIRSTTKSLARLTTIAVVLSLWGCFAEGTKLRKPADLLLTTAITENGDSGWCQVRFHVHWPEDVSPSWHADLLIAHRIAAPPLKRFLPEVKLWRFHRRAIRDEHGHQFSLIFYSSQAVARDLIREILANPTANQLLEDGTLEDISYDDPQGLTRTQTEDTSDESWPVPVQKSWPYYIMGVSRMWLELIQEIEANLSTENQEASPKNLLEHYAEVDQTITSIWQQDGQHVFLHHLSGLFAYEPLIIRDRRYMQF